MRNVRKNLHNLKLLNDFTPLHHSPKGGWCTIPNNPVLTKSRTKTLTIPFPRASRKNNH